MCACWQRHPVGPDNFGIHHVAHYKDNVGLKGEHILLPSHIRDREALLAEIFKVSALVHLL